MKGQISFVEYIVSFAVFSVFIAYMFFRLINYMPAYTDELRKEKIRSEAFQLSEYIINDPGSPINWDQGGAINRIGLSNIANLTNYISVSKVQRLQTSCTNNYNSVKAILGADYQFSISISDRGGISPPSVSLYCAPSSFSTRTINATVKRAVSFDNGNFGELTVSVW
jgi:hypothetical protein